MADPTVVAKKSVVQPTNKGGNTLTAQSVWNIARLLSFLPPLMLFLPFVYFKSVAGKKGLILSGFHILIGTHGLDKQMAQNQLDGTSMMMWAVGFMLLGLVLTIIRARKATFMLIPVSIAATAATYFSASMFTWIVKSGASLLWGFQVFLIIEILIMLATFVAVILKRVDVRTGGFKSHLAMFAMLSPGIIYLLIFSYLPLPGILLAFKKYNVFGRNVLENFFKSAWVGFDNFKFLFATPDAFIITRNTILYNLTFMILGLIFSVALAIGICELPNRRLAKLYQTTYFLPYFLSWMVVAYLAFALLNYDLGILNKALAMFGIEPVDWYMKSEAWPLIFIIANLWKYTGNGSIIYIATITGFDPQIYEAAAIDGAGKWNQIKKITIPMLIPMMTLLTILAVGRIFAADLGMFLSLPMGSGVLINVSNVIDLYVFNSLRSGSNIGLPSAAALYQSIVGFILILTTNTIVRKIDPDSALF